MNLRPFRFTETVRSHYQKHFRLQTSTVLKQTHLTIEDLNQTFKFEDNTFIIVGALENSKEMLIQDEATKRYFAVNRWELSQAVHPSKHQAWKDEAAKAKLNEETLKKL